MHGHVEEGQTRDAAVRGHDEDVRERTVWEMWSVCNDIPLKTVYAAALSTLTFREIIFNFKFEPNILVS